MVQPPQKTNLIRVSIVEDDAPDRGFLANLVAHADGFEFVSGFGCAEDSLAELPRQKPDVVPMTSYIARRVAQYFPSTPAQSKKDDNLLLSPREREVLDMLARGFLCKEIAEALNISVRTVDTDIRRIYEKLHVRSRAPAVAKHVNLPPGGARTAKAR